MHIQMTKPELIAALERKFKLAKADDERTTKKHQADEQAALMKFRAKAREALTWDWKTLKKNGFEVELGYRVRPDCPNLEAPKIKRVIEQVKLDTRKSAFSISPNTDVHDAVTWIPAAERLAATACE